MVRMVDEEMEVIVDFCMGSTVVHARVTGAVDINPKAKQLASLRVRLRLLLLWLRFGLEFKNLFGWAAKAELFLFKSKQKSCKLFIAINRPKS